MAVEDSDDYRFVVKLSTQPEPPASVPQKISPIFSYGQELEEQVKLLCRLLRRTVPESAIGAQAMIEKDAFAPKLEGLSSARLEMILRAADITESEKYYQFHRDTQVRLQEGIRSGNISKMQNTSLPTPRAPAAPVSSPGYGGNDTYSGWSTRY